MSLKIALVGPTDRSIWGFRKGLIKALIGKGHKVFVLCSPGNYVERIESLGAVHIPVNISRFMNPVSDVRYCFSLLKVFHREKFDFVHTFTIKPNFYGAIAARLSGIKKVFSLVEGLGFLFNEEKGFKPWLSRTILLTVYKIAFSLNKRVWFINQDDPRDLIARNILPEEKVVFIRSIGVDKHEFSWQRVDKAALEKLRSEFGATDNEVFVTLIGRMNWTKGIREFVEAARILKKVHPHTVFLLVGEIQEGSPYTVPEEYLLMNESENFRWLDFRSDILELIALSDIVVLPTYYREGVPRALLEAMALSKPLVTSNSVGCREVVEEGENGFMVEIKNEIALAAAIEKLVDNPALRKEFGHRSFEKVEFELDESIVVDRVLKELYQL